MRRPDINQWAKDCATIGIAARRFCYANSCLPNNEIVEALTKRAADCHAFACKYGMDDESALRLANLIAESVDLNSAF